MSKLYREKIDQLQAAEQRLLEQKAEAQRAARALTDQAPRDGDGLVREAQNAVKVLENEAMQRAGEAGQAADAALRSDAERTCKHCGTVHPGKDYAAWHAIRQASA